MAYQSQTEKLEKQYHENRDQYFAPYAEALRKGGDLELAVDVLRAGLTRRPTYLSAHIVLGRCLVDQKNDPEATKVFEQVLVLDAENIIALRFLAELTERSGNPAGALRWLRRLLEVDPMNDDAVEALKRLEALAPPVEDAPAPAAVAEPAEEPPEPAPVAGFEATSVETPPTPLPDSHAAANDFGIEQSSSPFESGHSGKADLSGVELGSNDIQFRDDGSVHGAQKLDLQEPEAEMVNLDATAPRSTLPDPPPSFEPPMLNLDAPPRVSTPGQGRPSGLAMIPLEPEPPAEPPAAEGESASSQDLPLIMPDDYPPETPAPPARPSAGPATDTEPEPVITETMAEVYLKQGLVAEARDVYTKLLQRRPGDAALREKLAALEQQRTSPPRGSPAATPGKPRFAAAETGGQSARSLFGKVLSARPGPTPAEPPPSQTAMDAAFASEPVQAQGAPTRATSDELSLAEVFGEDHPPQAKKPDQPGAAPTQGQPGFSFDEFFGGKPPADGAAASEEPAVEPEGGSPDDFVAWLKGLKS